MTRINVRNTAVRNPETRNAETSCVAWGKPVTVNPVTTKSAIAKNAGAILFAAVLVACSVTVGCSSDNDKPKPVTSSQIPVTQTPTPIAPAPVTVAENKPAPKKIVHKKPVTVNYTDKNSGVTFEYPRRYAIETGDAATDLLSSSPVPMNFVMPGGVTLAAVELPETSFANTDFSSAFFNVSVNKTLTADQCNQFAVPQPRETIATTSASEAKPEGTPTPAASSDVKPTSPETQPVPSTPQTASSDPAPAAPSAEPQGSKLMLGDLELRTTEAVAGEGSRQSDSKYFHVFQNGACYEFGLNVTTVASDAGVTKHVDRDKVFGRLEQILSTVKIEPVASNAAAPAAPEVTAETQATPAVSPTPAQ